MSEMNQPDRELQNRMPIGESLEVTLFAKKWFVLTKIVGRIRVVCVSPTPALLAGKCPSRSTWPRRGRSSARSPARWGSADLVIVSTAGFQNAREVAQSRPDGTVNPVEPNDAGGWTPHGPVETKSLVDLFDPEAEDEKHRRISQLIRKVSLTCSRAASQPTNCLQNRSYRSNSSKLR